MIFRSQTDIFKIYIKTVNNTLVILLLIRLCLSEEIRSEIGIN